MWNELTFLWNELTILWNDLTIDWNDLTWNNLTMERNDRLPIRSPLNRPWRTTSLLPLMTSSALSIEWRDLSSHTIISTIQSRPQRKKNTMYVTLNWKFPWKSYSSTHLPFLSSNPKILKAFPKTISHQNEAYNVLNLQQKKRKAKKERRRESEQWKVKTAVSLLNPNLEILLFANAQTLQGYIFHLV